MPLCRIDKGQDKYRHTWKQKVIEYDQEIQQSKTADEPMAPLGKATGHLQKPDIQKTKTAIENMSLDARKHVFKGWRTAKAQISLRLRAVDQHLCYYLIGNN